jgi:UDP-N-acetylmuramate dehydrogenase
VKHASVARDAAADLTLAQLTTMRVGGPAEQVLIARSSQELISQALDLWHTGEPWLLLGGGSNTVVSDDGYPGTVLLVRNEGIEQVVDNRSSDKVRLRVQAGHSWDHLVELTIGRGWSGIEALSGIPGLAGAAPMQNIGAYGAELSDVLHSVEFLDAELGEVVRLHAEELELGYRSSSLKHGREGVVLSLDLLLDAQPEQRSAPIRYGQLADRLGVALGDQVPLDQLRAAVLALRASKAMVLDESDHDSWSSGSFFTNPIVSEQFARTLPDAAPRFSLDSTEPEPVTMSLEELQRGVPLPVPTRPAAPMVKLSAAWLIEQSGITRGFHLPGSGAAISSKHTLAITNRGFAASAARVRCAFGARTSRVRT